MIKLIPIILGVLMTMAAVGVYVYTDMIYQRPLPQDKAEMERLKQDSMQILVKESYEIKVVTNIKSKSTKRLRYLEIILHLVPFKDEFIDKFKKADDRIRDSIIDIVGRQGPEELNSVAGKILLEERIKKRINTELSGPPAVKEIHFSTFVVQ